MPIPARISLVTLGVRDVRMATAFYRELGFELSAASVEGEVSFFRTGGGLLGLYGAADLAADAQLAPPAAGAFSSVSLAINVAGADEVDDAIRVAEQAGARVLKAPQATEWGGYHGYFADPDGHPWEVAHNPFWPLDDAGLPVLP
jgi:catechol 2,3-dioxygenase-like lactoylglutathione lyase family enzyme